MSSVPLSSSAEFIEVTPSDTEVLKVFGTPAACRGIFVGGSGDLAVKAKSGATIIFTAAAAGVVLPISTEQILSSNTTATDIVALF